MKPRLVADVDTGIDDMLALVYLAGLHQAGEIDLVGVTTTAGNTTAAQAAANTRHILALCGVDRVPVAAGYPGPVRVPLITTPETHGPLGLGYARAPLADPVEPVAAARLWHTVLADGSADLLVTGPLSTVARHPDLAARFATVTVMGGAVHCPGNTTAYAEWNFWVDPDAITAGLALHPTLCTLDITEQVTISPTEVASWRLGGELADVIRDALRFYFEFHEQQGIGFLAQVHDLLAAMVAVASVDVGTHTMRLGKDELHRGAIIAGPHPVEWVARVHPEAVRAEFARVINLS